MNEKTETGADGVILDLAGRATARRPRLVAWIHGTGGNGDSVATEFGPGWRETWWHPARVVCPTLGEGYHFLADGDARLEAAAKRLGLSGEPWIVGGFSGGAQFAHRFAWRRPERVVACVALAAGG